ncbi:MAG: hypothetical protein KDA93_19685 [Planctomycetaceae bacterium]|nr:hypothetical protein [Planctomycetaceae bacterium]
MKNQFLSSVVVSTLLLVIVLPGSTFAQHCGPIMESYLSEISLKHTREGELVAHVEYCRGGGNPQEAYQIHLLAYLDKHAATIPTPVAEDAEPKMGDELFDESNVWVLETKRIELGEDGCYDYEFKYDSKVLADQLISHLMSEEEVNDRERWGEIRSQIRFAVFIPFLDDQRYANLEGLPEDRHECNYGRRRALVWQQLPYRISLHRFAGDEPKYWIQIKGDQAREGFF